MDVLKLIPQLFFDLISRVVPGAAAIILVAVATDLRLGRMYAEFWEGAKAIQESASLVALGFFLGAYLVGQLISPLSDFVEQKAVKRLFPKYFLVLRDVVASASDYPGTMREVLNQEMCLGSKAELAKLSPEHFKNVVFVWYDWLRVNSPDAGARAAKVRAEYRMHSQNTVVLMAATVIHLMWSVAHPLGFSWLFIAVTVLAGTCSFWATARTYRTFQWTVINQFCSAQPRPGD